MAPMGRWRTDETVWMSRSTAAEGITSGTDSVASIGHGLSDPLETVNRLFTPLWSATVPPGSAACGARGPRGKLTSGTRTGDGRISETVLPTFQDVRTACTPLA